MRHNKNAGGRKHDTRMSFKEICRVLGITPVQRIKMIKMIKQNYKGGEHSK